MTHEEALARLESIGLVAIPEANGRITVVPAPTLLSIQCTSGNWDQGRVKIASAGCSDAVVFAGMHVVELAERFWRAYEQQAAMTWLTERTKQSAPELLDGWGKRVFEALAPGLVKKLVPELVDKALEQTLEDSGTQDTKKTAGGGADRRRSK